MLALPALPVTARPTRLVATPGNDAGAKVTLPSRAEVAVADSVQSGRRLASAGGFDFALLDEHLPDGLGTDLLRDKVERGLVGVGYEEVSHISTALLRWTWTPDRWSWHIPPPTERAR